MIKQITFKLITILFTINYAHGNKIADSMSAAFDTISNDERKLNHYFDYVSDIQMHDPNLAYLKAKDYQHLAKKLNNELHIGLSHYRLGSILHLQTKFASSMKELVTAQAIFKKIGNTKLIAKTDVELSLLYTITGNYKESEARLKKGIKYISTTNDLNRLGDLYFNLGNIKSFSADYDSALYYIQLSESYFVSAKDSFGLSRSCISMGSILHMKGDLNEALSYAKKALSASKRLEDLIGIQASLTSLGMIYNDMNQLGRAEQNLLNAYYLDSVIHNGDMTADVCKELAELYAKKGQHKLSNKYLTEHLTLKNQLFNPTNMNKLTEVIRKFELQSKEAELLEKEIETAKKKRWLIVVIGFLLLCLVVIWLLILRSKKTKKVQEKKIELYEAEQNILNEILERRNRELVANSLNLTKKEQILKSVSKELASIKAELVEKGIGDAKLRRVMREIRPEISRKSQNLFEKQFIDTHPKFYERILERSETLTPNERKLCAFLRLNMTTKEIAELTEQSPRAVEVARHRLRKKLKLKRSENLTSFLANLSTE